MTSTSEIEHTTYGNAWWKVLLLAVYTGIQSSLLAVVITWADLYIPEPLLGGALRKPYPLGYFVVFIGIPIAITTWLVNRPKFRLYGRLATEKAVLTFSGYFAWWAAATPNFVYVNSTDPTRWVFPFGYFTFGVGYAAIAALFSFSLWFSTSFGVLTEYDRPFEVRMEAAKYFLERSWKAAGLVMALLVTVILAIVFQQMGQVAQYGPGQSYALQTVYIEMVLAGTGIVLGPLFAAFWWLDRAEQALLGLREFPPAPAALSPGSPLGKL